MATWQDCGPNEWADLDAPEGRPNVWWPDFGEPEGEPGELGETPEERAARDDERAAFYGRQGLAENVAEVIRSVKAHYLYDGSFDYECNEDLGDLYTIALMGLPEPVRGASSLERMGITECEARAILEPLVSLGREPAFLSDGRKPAPWGEVIPKGETVFCGEAIVEYLLSYCREPGEGSRVRWNDLRAAWASSVFRAHPPV